MTAENKDHRTFHHTPIRASHGNLSCRCDGKGQVVTFTYDKLKRATTKNCHRLKPMVKQQILAAAKVIYAA